MGREREGDAKERIRDGGNEGKIRTEKDVYGSTPMMTGLPSRTLRLLCLSVFCSIYTH